MIYLESFFVKGVMYQSRNKFYQMDIQQVYL